MLETHRVPLRRAEIQSSLLLRVSTLSTPLMDCLTLISDTRNLTMPAAYYRILVANCS